MIRDIQEYTQEERKIMSGHSKWSTIKRQKQANDAKKGQVFSKLTRAISLAAKQGGLNPDSNVRLRMAIELARAENMPKENIERAIQKGGGAGENLQEALYEGYGPAGVGILVEATTDNKNRTTQEVKNVFERGGGSLGTPGSVAFQFGKSGQILVEGNEEETMLKLIDLGVEDIEEVEDGIEVYVNPAELFQMKDKLEQSGIIVKNTELVYRPNTRVAVDSNDVSGKIIKLLEALDEHDDVQKVYTNADIKE